MTGNLSAAEKVIDQALVIEPENAYYLQVQGGILADRGNCTGATEAYRHSIAINPDFDQPWPGLPNATTELGKTEDRCAAQGTRTHAHNSNVSCRNIIVCGYWYGNRPSGPEETVIIKKGRIRFSDDIQRD